MSLWEIDNKIFDRYMDDDIARFFDLVILKTRWMSERQRHREKASDLEDQISRLEREVSRLNKVIEESSEFSRGYEKGHKVGYFEGHKVGYFEGHDDGANIKNIEQIDLEKYYEEHYEEDWVYNFIYLELKRIIALGYENPYKVLVEETMRRKGILPPKDYNKCS